MSLPIASPEDVGLSARRLMIADEHIRRGQEQSIYSAGVLVVARHGRIAHQSAHGVLAPGGAPARIDSIFDLASLTKPHVAVSLLTLIEDGKLSLSQTVADHIPSAEGTAIGPLTLRQLATHTSGLPPWKPLFQTAGATPESPDPGPDAKENVLAEILATPLNNPPGKKYAYSDLGYILLGEIVSRTSGMPLDQYVHSRVLAPLGMNDTGYLPASALKAAPNLTARIAATSNSRLQGTKVESGHVHDENSRSMGGVAGHAGLFGTAPDLAVLASALAGHGESRGHRVLGLPTLRLARTNQISDPQVGGHSIGWFTPPNGMLPRGDILGDTAFGHTGFTGTMIVIDPAYELAIVLLTNRVINPTDNGGIIRIRKQVVNAAASSIIR